MNFRGQRSWVGLEPGMRVRALRRPPRVASTRVRRLRFPSTDHCNAARLRLCGATRAYQADSSSIIPDPSAAFYPPSQRAPPSRTREPVAHLTSCAPYQARVLHPRIRTDPRTWGTRTRACPGWAGALPLPSVIPSEALAPTSAKSSPPCHPERTSEASESKDLGGWGRIGAAPTPAQIPRFGPPGLTRDDNKRDASRPRSG